MAFPVQTVVEVMLAISLSAAAGFRVFIPLLALSTASVLGHVDLPARFDWIENPQAMTLFAIAALVRSPPGYRRHPSGHYFRHNCGRIPRPRNGPSGEMGTGPGLWRRCGGYYQGFDEPAPRRINSGDGRTGKPRICLGRVGYSRDSVGAGDRRSGGGSSPGSGHLWVWDL
jgi:hypothetical protein